MENLETKEKLKKHFEEQQSNHYDANTYIAAANKGIKELNEMIGFINKIEQDRTIIFSSLKEEMGDTRHNFFSVIRKYEVDNKKLEPHDFQKYLLEKLNIGFKEILENEGLDNGYRFTLSTPNTFPSKYYLYFEEQNLCRTDIINKIYGETAAFNEEYFQKLIDDKKTFIEKDEKEISKLLEIKESLVKAIKVPSDILIILFRRRKLKKRINERLEQLTSSVNREKEDLVKMENEIPIIQKNNLKTKQAMGAIEPLLKKYGYSFETNKSLLY